MLATGNSVKEIFKFSKFRREIFKNTNKFKLFEGYNTVGAGFDPVIEFFTNNNFGSDIVCVWTNGITSLADPKYPFFLTIPDDLRSILSNFYGVTEDTFGGTHAYRAGRFAVCGREGEAASVCSADWGHEEKFQNL